MTIQSLPHDRMLSEVAERQMRAWSLTLQNQQRRAERQASAPVPQLIQPYIAVSRDAGINGGEFACRIASELHWRSFDGELLDYLAERFQWSRLALGFVDEKAASWFHEMFGKWLDRQLVSQAEYVEGLGRVLLLAAQHESTVLVGRGAQFILPRASGFAVRIAAPIKQRVEHVMRSQHCERREAEKYVKQTDEGRQQFVDRYFHHDITDPHLYDLVINLARISMDDAVDLVVEQSRRRFPGRTPVLN
jgi:hypothetical protein